MFPDTLLLYIHVISRHAKATSINESHEMCVYIQSAENNDVMLFSGCIKDTPSVLEVFLVAKRFHYIPL